MLLDPNDYKDDFYRIAAPREGGSLDGDLSLGLFPTVRIAVGSASLSNAQGFGPEPMAKIGSASQAVAAASAVRQSARRAGAARPRVNLARDARGRNNWQDLGGQAPAPHRPARRAGGGSASTRHDSIEIADARHVERRVYGQPLGAHELRARRRRLRARQEIPLDMRFALAGASVAVKVDATMQAASR
jgi:AsmA protein